MDFEDARAAICSHMMANYPSADTYVTLPGFDGPDLADEFAGAYVEFDIRYITGYQASIEVSPVTRHHGEVLFAIQIRDGAGTKDAVDAAVIITNLFKTQIISGIIFDVPIPLTPVRVKDTYILPLQVPFRFDSIT